MGIVKPNEHFLFRAYSIAVKNWLLDNVYLSTYPENENVTIVYTTPDRAWAKYIYPVINGATLSPNINFHLTGYEYARGENFLGFVKEHSSKSQSKLYKVKPPLVYKLTYSAVIYTRNQPEMDVILYQILSQAHMNAKAVFHVDGQWAELMAGDPRDETNLEPGEAQSMINRFGIDLTIVRAYLPLESEEVQKILSTDISFSFDV